MRGDAVTDPDTTYGPMLIGFTFSTILLGLLFAQVNHYRRSARRGKDPLWLRIFVYGILLANVVNTAILEVFLYDAVIIHFGDLRYLVKPSWTYSASPTMTGFIAAAIQLFYSWRIFKLTRSYVVSALLVATITAGLVGALGNTYYSQIYSIYGELYKFQAWAVLWLVAECVADVAITAALVVSLRCKSTGMKCTDQIISRILKLAVPTGAVTALFALTTTILLLTGQGPGYDNALNFVVPKLYSISLMSSLNSRKSAHEEHQGSEDVLGMSQTDETSSHLRTTRIHFANKPASCHASRSSLRRASFSSFRRTSSDITAAKGSPSFAMV